MLAVQKIFAYLHLILEFVSQVCSPRMLEKLGDNRYGQDICVGSFDIYLRPDNS